MSVASRIAVDVQNVVFGYQKKVIVLNNISIEIPEGKIYALLGSNGCGKTTILRLLLGRIKPKSGSVRVFGLEPGSKQSDIPGSGVGFMPQNIALFDELTIEEILIYYGIVYHMEPHDIHQRTNLLIDLLHIPEKKSKICEISGGQQRLVSMAVTMIHKPRLLILDEPTVGVDSLLRCRIWQYLENICEKNGITVIITTHYIEEAKTAFTVGFMNSGILLTQSNPNELLVKHNCKTLQKVFFELCISKSEVQKDLKERGKMKNNSQVLKPEEIKNNDCVDKTCCISGHKIFDLYHMKALIWKSYISIKRSPLVLLVFFSVPVILIFSMSISIGQNLYKLPVAIHNPDIDPELSNLFIDKIDKKYINYTIYATNEIAINSVKNGYNWMAILFSHNFSDSFETRIQDPNALTDEEIQFSQIKLYADMSNIAIVFTIFRSLFKSFDDFLQNMSSTRGYNPFIFSFPINYEQPIYGTTELSFDEYLSPAIVLIILQYLPMIFSAFLVTLEKRNGYLERAFAAGIKPIEFLLSKMIQILIVILMQVLLTMFVLFIIFDTQLKGSVFDVFVVFVMQGLQGMSFGLLISTICSNEISAAYIVCGITFPLCLCSGLLWPIETMPNTMRAVIYWTPFTQPIESIRSIILRGWSIYNPKVLMGCAISLIYTAITSGISIFLIKNY